MRYYRAVVAAAAMLSVAACGGGEDAGNNADAAKGGRGGNGGGPVAVGFVVVQPSSVAMTSELPGRTAAFETSEVRPQVTGIIRRRYFIEGALVRAGQTLYQIDPRLYSAAANQARANLAAAAATAEGARIRSERYRPLAEMEAVSKQDYTDAVATQREAAAAVAQNRAALDTARVNLAFTQVPAPITGRIGRSLATVGALVSSNQTDPLAVIQRLDPMFVDIQQSSAALLALRRSLQNGDVAPASAQVRLKLEDGSDYAFAGTVQFAEVTVDQATGTVTLRARFPNPQGLLLPGMFVRAVFAQSIDRGAFLVPQQALSRDAKGTATVYLVGAGDKAVQRQVVAERTQGANWVVTGGLKAGDRVIVQGVAKLKPNAAIRPVAANAPQPIRAQASADKAGGTPGSGGR